MNNISVKDIVNLLKWEFGYTTLRSFIRQEPKLYFKLLAMLSDLYHPYEFLDCCDLVHEDIPIAIRSTDMSKKSSIIYKRFSPDISPVLFIQELTTYVETELVGLENEKISNDIKVHFCTQCGAALKKDSHVCEYCNTEYF